MARGYWKPQNSENLLRCYGFFVNAAAIPVKEPENRWSNFLNQVSNEFLKKKTTLKKILKWEKTVSEQSMFVLLRDYCVDVVSEDIEDYIAIFITIPENCTVPKLAKVNFDGYVKDLREILVSLYPGSVKYRKNYRELVDIG